MTRARRFFAVLYAVSGAAALVYEVIWTRWLALVMGHTVAATSTVLAAFMGGLALGGWLGGWRADRPEVTSRRALQLYAGLEIFIAIFALALPAILRLFVPGLVWAYADGTAPTRFALLRLSLSLTVLAVPAAAMGATYPLAAACLKKRGLESLSKTGHPSTGAPEPPAADAGMLYAANTAGAALGAIAAGFWLIPAFGLWGSTSVGFVLNVVAAIGALRLAYAWSIEAPKGGPSEPAGRTRDKARRDKNRIAAKRLTERGEKAVPQPLLACAVAAVSGFVALVYEVCWARLLALVIGPTTYAFATMAASFISGIALGSTFGVWLVRRTSRPALWLGGTLLVTAAAASFSGWFAASRLPLLVAAEVASSGAAFGSVIVYQAGRVTLLLLPMTLALGAAFPLALACASSGSATVGRDTARVYVANTLGAIAGALAAGFLLIPLRGLRGTFHDMTVVGCLGGVLFLLAATTGGREDTRRRRTLVLGSAVAVALLAATLAGLPWDQELLASGAYKYAPYLSAGELDTVLRAGRLEYYKEGAAATVSVRRLAGTLSMAIDGKVDASNAGDMLTQRLLGLLPVLLHGSPRDVSIIGLGSGVTLGSALAPGTVERADVVEISPAVVEASRLFDKESGRPLAAPGVRLIVGDGRSHLLMTPRQYDVIVSEPSNPWMAGVAALFTREFFEAARRRLKPDGLICQWAHTYDISSADLRSIVATFAAVFPNGSMWIVGGGDLLLIGSTGAGIESRLDSLASSWPRGSAPDQLARLGLTGTSPTFGLLSLYAGGPRELARYANSASIQTDDRMALEFSAPRGIYGKTTADNTADLRALLAPEDRPRVVASAFEKATDIDWTARGTMELKAEAFGFAYDAFRQAVTLNARNRAALDGLSQAAAGARREEDERVQLAEIAAKQPDNEGVRIELSRLLAAMGDYKGAAARAREAIKIAPLDPRPVEQFASIFADLGDSEELTPIADQLVARFPNRAESRYYHAVSLFLRGRAVEAADEAGRIVAADPGNARAQNLLGAACGTLGRRECAKAALEASIHSNPRDPAAFVNLGVFHLQTADPASATDDFAQALTLDPSSRAARDGLSQARATLNRP